MTLFRADLHVHTDASPDGRSPLPEIARAARAAGLDAVAIPYHRPGAAPEAFRFPLDGIESANARACFKAPDANALAAQLAQARGLPAVGGSDAHDKAEVGNAYTELEAEHLTRDCLRQALLEGRSRAVLCRNTPRLRKGLSQWTKARRTGGPLGLGRAAAYVAYCAALDTVRPL